MYSFLQDIRFGARLLARSPGFTAIALITLALGIGVNTATFSVVNVTENLPSQFADAERLAFIFESTEHDEEGRVSPLDYLDWCEQAESFTDIALFGYSTYFLSGSGEPERISGVRATANLMPMLGMEPQLGRRFTPDEDKPGADRVVLLSEKYWERKFARSPDVLGQTIVLNGGPFTIIGVMPPIFDLQASRMWFHVQYLTPMRLNPVDLKRASRPYRAVGKLKPDVTFEQAQAEMSGIAARLADAYPDTNTDIDVTVAALTKRFNSTADRLLFLALLAAVGMVLLIACANLANLLLGKATARGREFAVRTALGAGRTRIIRQLLTESLLLAILGGALGLLVGTWTLDALKASVDMVPGQTHEIGLNPAVLTYTLILSGIAALLFGLTPALMASRTSVSEALKEGAAAASAGRSRNRLRNGLVVAQLAIALPLFICCGLTIRHLVALTTAEFGFNTERLMTLQVDLPWYRYDEPKQWATFYHDALETIEAMPGIEKAAATMHLPVFGSGFVFAPVTIEGRPADMASSLDVRGYQSVTPEYFQTMGIPLLNGRYFSERDHAGAQPVALINSRMAQHYWPNEDPVGRRLTLDEDLTEAKWITIVGVVANAGCSFRGGPPAPTLFLPHPQKPTPGMTVVARTLGDPHDAIPALRSAIHHIDPGIPVYDFHTVAEIVRIWSRDDRAAAWFLGLLAALALGLACIGLYGVMSYNVVQRTHEIGVRVALGASRREIVRLVLHRCLRLAAIGIVTGLVLSIPVGLVLQSQLFGISGIDPLAYVAVSLILLAVAALAGYVPARRATRVDPMMALRCE
jgi:predicted permease